MKKIGLFGGSFNPIHNGHLHIARAFADELKLNTVIFLPAGTPYHKSSTQVAGEHRLAMVELAIEDEPRFAASDLDLVRKGATYTIETIQIFKQHYPNHQIWWLMGMDSLLQLHTWKNWQSLVRQTNIAVAARAGQTLNQTPEELQEWLGEALEKGSLKILSAPICDISSTGIREELHQDKILSQTLPEKVSAYIRKHNLYL
ncbi:nicotinate (nicotinamide) nucleotide adenylyltransferase [Kingella negevensis]|uniref:nicotinate (nicotinamide) nucleotide adenylyltransferase n=1 Tax=Kingella negevensis TaxID=1522312 RepID=UPI0025437A90|nr:nicotinate (nicotinamide) nucleotide adenylyltransferase [Kingella negevensis]WII93724.1 nicotinate (nicotinamide) nucleotide adenylyltransferase [Kingella negevensis]